MKSKTHFGFSRTAIFLALAGAGWTFNSRAEGPALSTVGPASDRPAWLTDLSAGIKESYDTSVFLSSVDPKFLVGTAAAPPGSVVARRDAASWVTAVSPKAGVNFAPLLGNQSAVKLLSLAYAPDFVFYHEQPSENYDAQRVTTSVKGGADAFSFGVDDSFSYVDGNKFAPTYPGNYVTAWNAVAPRERRQQIQERAATTLQYDWDNWFVRPTASLTFYDLMIKHFNVTGYQNYISRYDVNGGADAGYKLAPQLALTLGYRFGHQYQESLSFSPYNSSCDYQRALVGLEGKPLDWLEFKVQGGPDFRDYGPAAPVNNPTLVTYYGEASVTATLSSEDAVTIKYKQFQWVSACGKVPYFDSSYDVVYHRQVTEKLGADLSARLLTADYTSGNLATCERNDWQYTLGAGLGYDLNSHVKVTLSYALNLGRNDQSGIVNPSTRDYNGQLISAGALFKF